MKDAVEQLAEQLAEQGDIQSKMNEYRQIQDDLVKVMDEFLKATTEEKQNKFDLLHIMYGKLKEDMVKASALSQCRCETPFKCTCDNKITDNVKILQGFILQIRGFVIPQKLLNGHLYFDDL